MERELTLTYKDTGEPVDDKEVSFRKGGHMVIERTNRDGIVVFVWPGTWIDEVQVEQITVKENWDLDGGWGGGNGKKLSLKIDNPETAMKSDDHTQGVRGRLFYHDGTLIYQDVRMEVQLNDTAGKRFSTDDPRSRFKDRGEFFIATERYGKHSFITTMFAGGELIDQKAMHRDHDDGFYTIVLPRKFGQQGTGGGLITGRVLNGDGSVAFGAKVSAEVSAGGFLSFGSDTYDTKTDKHGHFVLPFFENTVVKELYVDGETPQEITIGKGEKRRHISAKNIPAGMFGITIVRKKKAFWGLF